MTPTAWPVVLLVLAAAVVIGWPTGGVRARFRALFRINRDGAAPARRGTARHLRCAGQRGRPGCAGPVGVDGQRGPVGPPNRDDPSRPASIEQPDPDSADRRLPWRWLPPAPVTEAARVRGLTAYLTGAPRRGMVLAAGVGAAGGLLAGPVAALVVGAYAALGARTLLRHRANRSARWRRRHRLDQLGALAADLRAGLPVPALLARPEPAEPGDGSDATDRIDRLTRAAVRLADRTGAPLAELVERIEADIRAMDRGLASAAAQAAGARATGWLLAGLPLGGIALGYAIGVDPVRVLLHTPVGAGCAVGATALQVVGLLWAERLGAHPAGAA